PPLVARPAQTADAAAGPGPAALAGRAQLHAGRRSRRTPSAGWGTSAGHGPSRPGHEHARSRAAGGRARAAAADTCLGTGPGRALVLRVAAVVDPCRPPP